MGLDPDGRAAAFRSNPESISSLGELLAAGTGDAGYLAPAKSNLNLTACETCGETILVCDNDVWLDWPARPYDAERAPWALELVGDIALAKVADVPDARRPPGTAGYALHLHQPL